jgi:hypothetical protein
MIAVIRVCVYVHLAALLFSSTACVGPMQPDMSQSLQAMSLQIDRMQETMAEMQATLRYMNDAQHTMQRQLARQQDEIDAIANDVTGFMARPRYVNGVAVKKPPPRAPHLLALDYARVEPPAKSPPCRPPTKAPPGGPPMKAAPAMRRVAPPMNAP